MSVDLNLDLERKRRLQPDMHQAEIQMNKTEVEEPTLATRRSDERFPFFTPDENVRQGAPAPKECRSVPARCDRVRQSVWQDPLS